MRGSGRGRVGADMGEMGGMEMEEMEMDFEDFTY